MEAALDVVGRPLHTVSWLSTAPILLTRLVVQQTSTCSLTEQPTNRAERRHPGRHALSLRRLFASWMLRGSDRRNADRERPGLVCSSRVQTCSQGAEGRRGSERLNDSGD